MCSKTPNLSFGHPRQLIIPSSIPSSRTTTTTDDDDIYRWLRQRPLRCLRARFRTLRCTRTRSLWCSQIGAQRNIVNTACAELYDERAGMARSRRMIRTIVSAASPFPLLLLSPLRNGTTGDSVQRPRSSFYQLGFHCSFFADMTDNLGFGKEKRRAMNPRDLEQESDV